MIGAHTLSNLRVTICCSRGLWNLSRLNYSTSQFRTTQDYTPHQVYETVCSLNCKAQLKQAGLCICCFLPPLFLLAVSVWTGSVFVQRAVKTSDRSRTLAQNLNFFSVASKENDKHIAGQILSRFLFTCERQPSAEKQNCLVHAHGNFCIASVQRVSLSLCWGVIHTCRWGELQQDAVAAQCDDERLLPHTAALGLPGNGTLEHTRLLSW